MRYCGWGITWGDREGYTSSPNDPSRVVEYVIVSKLQASKKDVVHEGLKTQYTSES